MFTILPSQTTVTPQWLNTHLYNEDVIVLDATMGKDLELASKCIKGARYFDISKLFSDTSNPFPNAFPSENQFQEEARKLGINRDSIIVVYDDKGIYSSARAWWMFKAYGHENIAVLDGGFPAWLQFSFSIEEGYNSDTVLGNFMAHLQKGFVCFFKDVKKIIDNKNFSIIDARSAERFQCKVPEPREGLRSGQIPNSENLPYTDVLDNGMLKSKNELKTLFKNSIKDDKTLICSCGSGITACILALALYNIDYKRVCVYDGSWTEWGTQVKV